jgi:hypothetical protein
VHGGVGLVVSAGVVDDEVDVALLARSPLAFRGLEKGEGKTNNKVSRQRVLVLLQSLVDRRPVHRVLDHVVVVWNGEAVDRSKEEFLFVEAVCERREGEASAD